MGRKPSDAGWAAFQAELGRFTTADLARELGLSTMEVGDLKRGRQRPAFAELPRFSAVMFDGDPTALAARMGMIPSMRESVRDLVRARAELTRLEEQIAQARPASADLVQATLSELMNKVLHEGRWAIAIWPGLEGVAPWRLHYRDRIDLRRTDGQPLQLGETRKQFGALLDTAGAEPGAALPRWDDGPSPTADTPEQVSHWVVPRLARETYPSAYLPLRRVTSVTVVSTTATGRPDAVGAIIARVLGYGFTSAAILSRRLYGGDVNQEHLDRRADLHHQWVAHPQERMVWAHFGRDTPTRDGVSVDGLGRMEDAAVVWIYEPDELLRQKAGRVPRTRGLIEQMSAARDNVEARLTGDHVYRVRLSPTQAAPNTADANDERMNGSLDAAADVIEQLVARGVLEKATLERQLTSMSSGDSDSQVIASFLRARADNGAGSHSSSSSPVTRTL